MRVFKVSNLKNGDTSLHALATCPYPKVVEKYLSISKVQKGYIACAAMLNKHDRTAMHLAIATGHDFFPMYFLDVNTTQFTGVNGKNAAYFWFLMLMVSYVMKP